MESLKAVAFFAVFVVGVMVLGAVAVLAGSPWGTVFVVWLGFWIVVAVLAELANPSE